MFKNNSFKRYLNETCVIGLHVRTIFPRHVAFYSFPKVRGFVRSLPHSFHSRGYRTASGQFAPHNRDARVVHFLPANASVATARDRSNY